MISEPTPGEMTAFQIQRLIQAVDALANPLCCRGAGTSLFQVMAPDGQPTGEQVRVCNNCGREIQDPGPPAD